MGVGSNYHTLTIVFKNMYIEHIELARKFVQVKYFNTSQVAGLEPGTLLFPA